LQTSGPAVQIATQESDSPLKKPAPVKNSRSSTHLKGKRRMLAADSDDESFDFDHGAPDKGQAAEINKSKSTDA
jgi:hypothetical protein